MTWTIDPFWRWWNFSLLDLLQGLGRRAGALLERFVAPGKVMAVVMLLALFVLLHEASKWERAGAPRWLRRLLDRIGPFTGARIRKLFIGAVVVWGLLVLRPLVLSVALILVGVTVWTYRGVEGVGSKRLMVLAGLRLLAGLSALVMVVQPAFTAAPGGSPPGTLLLLFDASASMRIPDEAGNQSRWGRLQRISREAEPLLEKLQKERKVRVVRYQFAADLRPFDSESRPNGPRTDFGEALRTLYEQHAQEEQLWGLLIFSDGADNGIRYQPLVEAARWRSLSCPIHTFGLGRSALTEAPTVHLTEGEEERTEADHAFLAKLAQAGGGRFYAAEELPHCLKELHATPRPRLGPRGEVWPDWRTPALTEFRGIYLGLLMGLLCLEWFCRRRWGLA